jgi:electron transfer flavoprotein beta subunit
MHIIVCLKQIIYIYARTGLDPDLNFLSPGDRITRINPSDEAALELALRVKESREDCRVTLLTLGPLIAEIELRRCLALGADRLCRIDLNEELDSRTKARVLALFIKDLQADLIFCGKESRDSQNGQVGAFLASFLSLPFLSNIREVSFPEKETMIHVIRGAGRGIQETIACPPPALLAVEGGSVQIRLPIHSKKIESWSYDIEVLRFRGDIPPASLVRKRVFPPRPRTLNNPAPDSRLSAAERIQQLLSGSRVEKKGQLLSGSPELQVEGIISFMKDHGFLGQKSKGKEKQEDA